MSDSGDGMGSGNGAGIGSAGVASVRRYNHLSSTLDCDISTAEATPSTPISHCLSNSSCDSSSSSISHLSSLKTSVAEDTLHNSNLSWPFVPKPHIEKNELSSDKTIIACSSSHLSMVKLEDIMKESKTSNVNVLAKDSFSNNELFYDSEKYAKIESKKLKNSVDNLSRGSLKRVKEVNLLVDKIDNSQHDTSSLVNSSKQIAEKTISSAGRNSVMALNKRIRLEEKNIQYEIEKSNTEYYDRVSEGIPSSLSPTIDHGKMIVSSSLSSEEQKTAEECWKAFVGDSKSAVVDTFYGQFKSSVSML